MIKRCPIFMDGVTGYLGRWTLFWYLQELRDEPVCVLIRPGKKGDLAREDAERRLDAVLTSIGMQDQKYRVSAIAGDLAKPFLGNRAAIDELQADCWMHIAGDVSFKKLGDKGALVTNRDYTANFIETARKAHFVPRTVCHTSTFYTYEKANEPKGEFWVKEEFHDPGQMVHHNAYGYSKLAAETYLHELVKSRTLPFNLLIFRPDIIMHHIPAREVALRNPGLVTDDFKVIFQLIAVYLGKTRLKLPGGPSIASPLKYLPANLDTVVNISDVDSVTRAMMQLALLFGDGGLVPDERHQIFQLVNRWQPLSNRFLVELSQKHQMPGSTPVQAIAPDQFQKEIWPKLSWLEKMYYGNFVEPFVGYMARATTHACTANVDRLLGDTWHYLHPSHQIELGPWLETGALQAIEKDFGESPALCPI